MSIQVGGFIQIINYAGGGSAFLETFAILTESSQEIMTENSLDLLTEASP
jgi:hypothetical protein